MFSVAMEEEEIRSSLRRRLLNDTSKCSVTTSRDTLRLLFTKDALESGDSLTILRKIGEAWQFANALGTSLRGGIDPSTIPSRIEIYGGNQPIRKKPAAFLRPLREAVEDTTLRILVGAALLSLLIGLIDAPGQGWLEAVAILVAVVTVVLVTTVNDYLKDQQFRRLSAQTDVVICTVVRDGQVQEVAVSDLVVGDLLRVKLGMIIPADGVLVHGHFLHVEERGDSVRKEPYGDNSKGTTAFLLSGSKVMDGYGAMLVCAVGRYSSSRRLAPREMPVQTPLQKKLGALADRVGKLGSVAAVVVFLVLVVYDISEAIAERAWDGKRMQRLVSSFIIAVTIVVVAVPEGLPLAVTLSLAYSLGRMREEKTLVRHLQACETMGGVTDVCTEKTAVLTDCAMTVETAYLRGETLGEGKAISVEAGAFRDLLMRSFCLNSGAGDSGARTERALLALAQSWQLDCNAATHKAEFVFPFSSERKWMAAVVRDDEYYSVFITGAAERIVRACKYVYMKSGIQELTEDDKELLERQVIGGFATRSLRTLAVAYRTTKHCMNLALWGGERAMEFLMNEATLLGVFGLRDSLRGEAGSAIAAMKKAGVTVRMVTGDNVDTAIAIAKRCDILPTNFSRQCESRFAVMEGSEFEREVGELLITNSEVQVKNLYKFIRVISELRVLARAAPLHKLALVAGIKQMENRVVAATGDGASDARMLKVADVGFAMNLTSSQVAKDASDIILTDDSFASIVTALKWGRNIYDSIRKFIQFQLTVNLVVLSMSIIGAVALGRLPLSAVQMLWINLIMDTFAALALATEPPSDTLLNFTPYRKGDSLIDEEMKKTMLGMAVYQVACLTALLFFGPSLFGLPASWEGAEWSEERCRHFTMFFHSFVFLQIFNEINCRKLRSSEFNVFRGFCNNPLFLIVLASTVTAQLLIVQFGGEAVSCSSLSVQQHAVCMGVGASALVAGALVRLLPSRSFAWVRLSEDRRLGMGRSMLYSMLRRNPSKQMAMVNSALGGAFRIRKHP